MLYPQNPVLLNTIKKETTEQFIRQAEMDRLASQSEPRKQSWLFLPSRQGIERLGHQLIAWGERLEHFGTKTSV
jgi:hypothetical protein